MSDRVAAFIDGFNLYHAIDSLSDNPLKWLNLWELVRLFSGEPTHRLTAVYYFSAFATWKPGPYKRHREYVAALEAAGVTPVMGFFKEKDRWCKTCRSRWSQHEEKETDVNIALHMLRGAYSNAYDRAILLSGDSDLAPVVRMLRSEFPKKPIRLVAPPRRRHSKEIIAAFGGKASLRSIKKGQLRRCLFPREVPDRYGKIVAIRPLEYDP